MANSNNWGEIYKSTWWGDKAWSANTLFIDSAPPGFGLNLLKASEDMDNTLDWKQVLSSVVANSTDEAAPNSTDTAEKITFTADRQSRIQQQIALEANTTYTFSVYAKVRTGTKAFRLRNSTLGQAQQFTADTSWGLNPDDGRYSFSFTTGATAITHTLSIQNAAAGGSGEVFFWGAMLNEGATAGDYVKTDASVGGSAPTPAYSGFGDAFGGVTAYYSLRQFTEAETLNAIRVRRSSDDTEQDIGFDANGDLDTTALTTFVNEDVDVYTSDFSSTEDLSENSGTGAAAQSVGGVDDAYKFTLSGGGVLHQAFKGSGLSGGGTATLSVDYYIPSTNTAVDGIQLGLIGGTTQSVATTDAWTSVVLSVTNFGNGNAVFRAKDGGNAIIDADGDVFYLKNIVITQTTADGAVTTFYDQSGNGNNATNATATQQPLVVSGGTLVEENGKAAIDFDGVDDELEDVIVSIDSTAYSAYMVANTTGNTSRALFRNRTLGGYGTQEGAAFFELNNTDTLQNTFIDDGAGNALGIANGASVSDGQHLLSTEFTTSSAALYVDGSSTGTHDNLEAGSTPLASVSLPYINIGGARFSRPWSDTVQEIILFDSDQSTNRTGIETNINDHFDIYTP